MINPARANVAFACGALLAVGCGGLPLAPAVPSDDDGFSSVELPTPPGLPEDPPQAMSLTPGDVVTLRMTRIEVENIEGLSVDERGMLHVPLAGDVPVAGLPLTTAEQRVEEAMRPFDSTVRVTILLSEPIGHQASVVGAVGEQGRHPVFPGMRLADLVAAAGGGITNDNDGVATSLADFRSARLVRAGETLPVSVELALTGHPHHNVHVRAGDYLYVPPQLNGLVSVLGQVSGARVMAHRPGLRLSQALGLAGGITRDANGGDIRIIRGLTSAPRVYRAAIDHVAAGDQPDPVLAPGDIVYVGSSALADFRDVMNAIAPIISIAATTAVGFAISLSGS